MRLNEVAMASKSGEGRTLAKAWARAIAAANSTENKQRLKDQTSEAIARGIYGAPSVTVGDELFWGNDRLERAVDWAFR